MYYVRSNYCQSELKGLERRAVSFLRVLENKIVMTDQIADIKDWLEKVREQLELENPRCKSVEVTVKENPLYHRLDICFGNLSYYGIECNYLNGEDMAL